MESGCAKSSWKEELSKILRMCLLCCVKRSIKQTCLSKEKFYARSDNSCTKKTESWKFRSSTSKVDVSVSLLRLSGTGAVYTLRIRLLPSVEDQHFWKQDFMACLEELPKLSKRDRSALSASNTLRVNLSDELLGPGSWGRKRIELSGEHVRMLLLICTRSDWREC